jgi:hypothetical protein
MARKLRNVAHAEAEMTPQQDPQPRLGPTTTWIADPFSLPQNQEWRDGGKSGRAGQ